MVIVYQKETRKIICHTSYFAIQEIWNRENGHLPTFHEIKKIYCHKSPFGHTYTIAIGENNHVVIISKLIDALRFETLGQIVDPFRPRYHDMYAPRF